MKGRYEYKYNLNYGDYLILRTKLRALLLHDKYAGPSGEYTVRNLYFDTPSDKALREKIDGVNMREKFRIRHYNGDLSFIMLEKKSKVNGLGYKSRELISEEELRMLENGNLSWMASGTRPLVFELYQKMINTRLRPKTIVEYIREPFIFPAGNVRVTLDRDIHTAFFLQDFADPPPSIRAGDEIVLMEVKYDEFLPDFVRNIVNIPNRRAAAFSKYAAARTYG